MINYISLIILTFLTVIPAQPVVRVMNRTFVNSKPEAMIRIEVRADSSDAKTKYPVDWSKFYLDNGNGEKVYCSRATVGWNLISFFFPIDQTCFYVFEKLVSDSSGYCINNEEEIRLNDSASIKPGELRDRTENSIGRISRDSWDKYVLNSYSANYLYPQTFDVGTQLGTEDSTKTSYYLNLVQSGSWGRNKPVFWGIKGRWSTDTDDKANFVQLYPVTILWNRTGFLKLSAATSVECGYAGFERQGRASFLGDARFRLPFNLVDLTFGEPRVRVNPLISITLQGGDIWTDFQTIESHKMAYDAIVGIRYGIPVSNTYYLLFEGKADYGSEIGELKYQYKVSLGYIANGTIRIALAYSQGYQVVSYVYDRKLLLGFVFDALNQTVKQGARIDDGNGK